MVLGTIQIIAALLDIRPVGYGWADRVVVSNNALAAQDLAHDLVAIDAVLEGQAQVQVVEGGHVDEHRQGAVRAARNLVDDDVVTLLQVLDGLEIRRRDCIQVPC